MGQIKYVSCSQLRTGGTYTYQRPANKLTGDCESYWKVENFLNDGAENLTLPDCRRTVQFITICDVGGERVDHNVTYRVIDPIPDPNTTMNPLGIQIWLPFLIVVVLLFLAGIFIMYRRKMFCFVRANGSNPADGNRDLRDAEDGISGASDPLNNNHTPPGPNRDAAKTDHMNGGENIPMVQISNGGSHSLNDDPPPV